MGGVVYRGDCGVCGWKDRCRVGNLRTYCHVSPILFVFGSRPYMFLYFCEMLFLSDDVTASCYDCQITTQVHVLSCIIFKICLPMFLECNHQGQSMAVSSVTQMNDCLNSPVSLIPSGLLY